MITEPDQPQGLTLGVDERVTNKHTKSDVAATTVATTSTSGEDDTEIEVFPFFDLPREMRDKIYESVEPDTFDAELPCCLKIKADKKCNNLLAVSKQFRKEYEESVARLPRTSSITDAYTTRDFEGKWKLPAAAGTATHIEINMTYDGAVCTVEEELDLHSNWITAIFEQLTNVESLSMRIDVQEDDERTEEFRERLNEEFWVQMPYLKSLVVYQSDLKYTDDFTSETPQKRLLEFSPESKTVETADQQDDCGEVLIVGG